MSNYPDSSGEWLEKAYQPMRPSPERKPSSPSSVKPRTDPTQAEPDASAAAAVAPRSSIDILTLMDHPALFGPWFTPKRSWFAWRVVLAAAFGLPIERTGNPDAAMKLFRHCTGRTKWPTKQSETLCVVAGVRSGKLLALDTPILTPDGFKANGDIESGDRVFDEHGKPTRVLEVYDETPERAYRMMFSDGSVIEAGGEHEWVTFDHRNRKQYDRRGFTEKLGPVPPNWPAWSAASGNHAPPVGAVRRTTDEIAQTLLRPRSEELSPAWNHSIPVTKAVEMPPQSQRIPPYLLGLWLGDGHSKDATVSGDPSNGDLDWYENAFRKHGFTVKRRANKTSFGVLRFLTLLRADNLLQNKHVPKNYLFGSIDQRLSLLQGLLDSDGYADPVKHTVEFSSTRRQLADAVLFLARSLGQKPVLKEGRARLYGRDIGPKYRITWRPTVEVFRLPRKLQHTLPVGKLREGSHHYRMIRECQPIPPKPMRCLVVDSPNHLYLAGEALIPTHNSRLAALIATYLACLRSYEQYLSPGERGFVPVVAADRKQARAVFNYTQAFVTGTSLFQGLLAEEMKERLVFNHGIDIEVMTASFKALRGYSMVSAVLDELAYFSAEDAANPDHEILASVRRGAITIPDSMLVMISSPYARRGVLWDTYKEHFGDDDSSILVWNAPTWYMNLTITRDDLQPEFDRDPEKAQADYGGKFRKDVERFVPMEVIEACIDPDRRDLPPQKGHRYVAFVDPSGGSQDSMTLAIAHREDDMVVIDAVYEWRPPFSPDSVVKEMANVLARYKLRTVTGDRYGGEWPAERFSAHGVSYEVSKKTKSELYRDLLPIMNEHRLRMPDVTRLKRQLWDLERRTTRAGKDSIDHPKGSRDDLANSAAGAAVLLSDVPKIRLTW